VLIRFAGVIIIDGSVIGLPADRAVQFPGGANQTGHQAAPKIGVELDLLSGRLDGPYPIAARPHDRLLPIQDAPVAPGVLRLAGRPPGSIGFFDLTVLAALSAQRAYWLTRVQHGTVILDGTGRRRDLVALLRRNCKRTRDRPMLLGLRARLPCRLIAERVPRAVADERRRGQVASAR
jgi:hypothetical protein